MVFGGLLQPWRLTGGEPAPELDAAALRAWDAPGWIKVAMDFRLTPTGGGTELSSETRVTATDDASRTAFARYWRVIRHGSTRRPLGGAHRGRAARRPADLTARIGP